MQVYLRSPILNSSLDAVFVLIVTSTCSSYACVTKRCQCLPHLLSRTGETCSAPPGLATPCPWSTWLDCKTTPSDPMRPSLASYWGRSAPPMIYVWIPCHFQCYQRHHQNCMHWGNMSVTDECKEGIQGVGAIAEAGVHPCLCNQSELTKSYDSF